jgi:polyferredoxin
MISTKKINKLKNVFDNIIHILFLVIGELLRIGIMVFIGFGAIASMLLLYKIFPETATILFAPLIIIFEVLYKIFLVLLTGILVFGSAYLIICLSEFFKKETKKQELKKKQFITDIARELKKDSKKK